jgi:glutathione synthase/RimK-type ligase-like ATP-grasp enzyme
MILIITNRADITSDLLVLRLQERNIPYYRLNTEAFPSKISLHIVFTPNFAGSIYDKETDRKIDFSEIRSVYYRRPSFPRPSIDNADESRKQFAILESLQAFRGFIENLDCFWVSRPSRIRYAENKITQLNVARKIGFKVPKTVISNNPKNVIDFIDCNKNDVVIKPVKSGFVSDEEIIFTNVINSEKIVSPNRIMKIPSIYQQYIRKKYDIRVTVFGEKVFPVEIHSQGPPDSRIDWRKSSDLNMVQKEHVIPKKIQENCLRMTSYFGLEFGAIDMVLSPKNEYFFLEINPNGQWAWLEQRTNYKLTDTLIDLLLIGKGVCQKNG